MTATLLGSYSLGDAIPGLKDALNAAGQGLQSLKGTVDSAIGTLNTLKGTIDGLASDLDSAKDGIVLGPVNELNDAIDTAQSLLSELLTLNAPDYLSGAIAGLNAAVALLESLVASDYLNDAIAGVQGAINGQQARLDTLASNISDLTDIEDDVRLQTAALGSLANTLQTASNAVIGALVAYNQQVSEMLNTGVYVVAYTGPLSSLGSDVDGVLPGTGIGGSTNVSGPLLIVETANTSTLAALNNAFGL